MITYNAEGVKMPKIRKRGTSRWIKAVIATHGRKVGGIGYMFVGDEKTLGINNEYFRHDYYTDIITFSYDKGNALSSDLVISPDTAHSNAELFEKSYEDEPYRVIIHGILHLRSINDKGPGERGIMEESKNEVLALLKRMQTEK